MGQVMPPYVWAQNGRADVHRGGGAPRGYIPKSLAGRAHAGWDVGNFPQDGQNLAGGGELGRVGWGVEACSKRLSVSRASRHTRMMGASRFYGEDGLAPVCFRQPKTDIGI